MGCLWILIHLQAQGGLLNTPISVRLVLRLCYPPFDLRYVYPALIEAAQAHYSMILKYTAQFQLAPLFKVDLGL